MSVARNENDPLIEAAKLDAKPAAVCTTHVSANNSAGNFTLGRMSAPTLVWVIAPYCRGILGILPAAGANRVGLRRNTSLPTALAWKQMEPTMTSKKLALTTVLLFAFTAPALAQGAGGAGGGAASGAGAAAPAAPSGTVGTAGNSSSATGGTQDRSPEVKQSNTAKIVADEKAAAVEGSKTKPSAPGSGTVSAPGVGVGTAANGLPIGAPGSGLGSPENSIGPK